jgi:hypothetical protein
MTNTVLTLHVSEHSARTFRTENEMLVHWAVGFDEGIEREVDPDSLRYLHALAGCVEKTRS